MSDPHEQDTWDQDEVEIVDLGAPDRGLSRYFFNLGENLQATAPLRAKLVSMVVALCLLIAVLQPASSGMNTRTPGAPHTMPTYSLPSTIYIIDCVTISNTSSSPAQANTWQQLVSRPSAQGCSSSSRPGSQCYPLPQLLLTPSSQGVVIGCSVGTPLPVSAGKNGKNR
ncbi:MAG TPA: hypothetical protein VIZ18_16755 [Ktedonobacteraceae bacterium]